MATWSTTILIFASFAAIAVSVPTSSEDELPSQGMDLDDQMVKAADLSMFDKDQTAMARRLGQSIPSPKREKSRTAGKLWTDHGSSMLEVDDSPRVEEDLKWKGFPELGQISGLSVDGDGNLHIFHRGDRVWDASTFTNKYELSQADREMGPISNDTVLVIDPATGRILYSWGSNRFYIPHGLTVDQHGNTWVTDVGLHQVFKFHPRENQPSFVLGEAFVPGAGSTHFCKPTDVAVTQFGNFFVSDGYCNSRILMYSRAGRLLQQIGAKDGMAVPHSLTLVPSHDALCVADRENWRILCYSSGLDGSLPGIPLARIEGQGLGRVFAVDRRGNQLFAVNGPDPWQSSQSVSASHGLVLDIESGTPKTLWGPERGFLQPHDLAVSPDGKFAYVSEIDLTAPKKVYKFRISD